MTILITAFLLGLMGSLHCVGMCGPIALSLPLRGHTIPQKIWGSTLWSLGRIVTYSLMGGLFGLIGAGFKILGYQQVISIVIGVGMILSVILPSLFKKIKFGAKLSIFDPIRKGMQRLFREKNNRALFLIGIFNGLLPCGLVYFAIAGAIASADLLLSIGYMALFGLGTLPMLLLISLLGNVISQSLRNQINKIIPVVVVLIGMIFILRGLSLGIPYLSPPKEKLTPTAQMNMGKPGDTKEIQHSCCQKDTIKSNAPAEK
ncbi:MAG: sulfite exporter TauE/SafE family protein [Prolixibacteraceae bacterium]|nr:sulfite exporter TauE/SafE family protein [Prolixibacteraceae bacterium]